MNKWEIIHIIPRYGIEEFPTDVDYLLHEIPTLIATRIINDTIKPEEWLSMSEYSDTELMEDLLCVFRTIEVTLSNWWLPKMVAISYALWKKNALIERYKELGDESAIVACETAFALFKLRLN